MPVIDPTKNVLDLVAAQEKLRDALRDADAKFETAIREADVKARDAETRRIDQLAALRVYYDAIIEGMRSDSLKLLAEQLKENKAESGSRMGLLEQFRWESGGKTSVADPALSKLLAEMTASIQELTKSETRTDTRRENTAGMFALAVGAATVVSAIVTFAGFTILHLK